LLAAAPVPAVAAYAAMGRAIGVVCQLRSDCYDLFVADHSKDFAAGARSLPIALCLDRLPSEQVAEFLELLDAARTDEGARRKARSQLRSSGALRACAAVVEGYCRRAHQALATTGAREPAATGLRGLIDAGSLLA
jgi:geranylgeranyl pyrophosphate synthase